MFIKISVKKETHKPSILTVIRADGSSTWSRLHRGVETYDLAHYAVESVLGFKNAFYGIIDDGYAISDFELPKDKRPKAIKPENLNPEALITEHIVNLLEVEFLNSGKNANFIVDLNQILTNANLPFPDTLNNKTLSEIRKTYQALVFKWRKLKDREVINLTLNL